MNNTDLRYGNLKEYNKLLKKINKGILKERRYEKVGNFIAASTTGIKTWSYLKKLMKLSDAPNICDIEGKIIYDLLAWASSFADNLHNASLDDETIFRNKFIFCKEYIEMHENFLAKNMRNLGNIRRCYAECYVDIGELGSCDSLY